jgi:hypothetical protein
MVFTKDAQNLFQPHKFFCWLPVTVVDAGEVKVVWLGYVQRKLVSNMMGSTWVYTL